MKSLTQDVLPSIPLNLYQWVLQRHNICDCAHSMIQRWFPPIFRQWFKGLNSHLRCEISPPSHHPPSVFQKGQCSCQNLEDDFRYGNLFPGKPGPWEMGCVWRPLQHFPWTSLGSYQAGGGRYLRSHPYTQRKEFSTSLWGEDCTLASDTWKSGLVIQQWCHDIRDNGGTVTHGVEMSKLVSNGRGVATFHKGETPFSDTNVSALSLK